MWLLPNELNPVAAVYGAVRWSMIAFVMACDVGGASSPARTQPRDSAGIAIVEHSTLDVPSWTLDAGGAIEATGADLFRVVGARRLEDGRVVVANAGSSELFFFDAAGALTQRVGRAGAGPGEFLGIERLFTLGSDSLLVYDRRLDRFNVYDDAGSYVRTFRFDPRIDPILTPEGLVNDAEVLSTKTTHMVALTRLGTNVDSALVLRFDRDGTVLDSLQRVEHNHRFRKTDGRMQTTVGIPFAPEGRIAVHGDTYCYGTGARYEIHCFAADGRLLRVIRASHSAQPVTGEMIDAYFFPPGDATARLRNARQRLRADLPIPTVLPHFDALRLDDDGNLWVREYLAAGANQADVKWTIFDGHGVAIAVLTTPFSVRPLHIGHDFIVAVWHDELDVERVSVFRLTRN